MADDVKNLSDSFEVPSHDVCKWPTSIMGFDPSGGTKSEPAGVDYARQPDMGDSIRDSRTGPARK